MDAKVVSVRWWWWWWWWWWWGGGVAFRRLISDTLGYCESFQRDCSVGSFCVNYQAGIFINSVGINLAFWPTKYFGKDRK